MKSSDPAIAKNREAFHDYHILETVEAGIVLKGPRLKAFVTTMRVSPVASPEA